MVYYRFIVGINVVYFLVGNFMDECVYLFNLILLYDIYYSLIENNPTLLLI